MIISSGTKKPNVHASAYVAPTATVSGEVTIEEGCAVLFGAVISAEGAPVTIGANSVVMENAVVKSSGGKVMQFPCTIGESCIVGPGAYIVGATIEPGAFIASGAPGEGTGSPVPVYLFPRLRRSLGDRMPSRFRMTRAASAVLPIRAAWTNP